MKKVCLQFPSIWIELGETAAAAAAAGRGKEVGFIDLVGEVLYRSSSYVAAGGEVFS